MEIDYGAIKIINKLNINNILTIYVIGLQCAYGNITKGGIKTHLSRKQNPPQLHYNLNYPYFPKTYKDVGSLIRHIYKNFDVITVKKIYFSLTLEKFGQTSAQKHLN